MDRFFMIGIWDGKMWIIEALMAFMKIRVEVGSEIFRVFSFFDKGQIIVLINGFQKKSQKTPKKEIEMAEKLKKTIL